MYKVFIAEDEGSVREEIREILEKDSIYTISGEAADGELALPIIQELKPDILITDINMPFMDGLELSAIVKSTMPWIHIIILSGFDEFDYAQKAIEIGVESYLLKPIIEEKLMKTVNKVAVSIEKERNKMLDSLAYKQKREEKRMHDTEHFFNQLMNGALSSDNLYKRAEELQINLFAPKYTLLFISLVNVKSAGQLRACMQEKLQDEENVFGFSYGDSYLVLVKGNEEKRVVEQAVDVAQMLKHEVKWLLDTDININIGKVLDRVSELPQLCKEMREDVLSISSKDPRNIVRILSEGDEKHIQIDFSKDAPLAEKLRHVELDDLNVLIEKHFAASYAEEPRSILFRYYLLVDLVVTSVQFLHNIGLEQDANEISNKINEGTNLLEYTASHKMVVGFAHDFLTEIISKRDKKADIQHSEELRKAREYIKEYYADEDLSLHTVAKEVGFSPNYFSTVFSQKMGVTFIEYLINYRIERGKEYLKTTDMKLSDIAFHVGYGEPRYFGHVFKKVTGMSPSAYRKQSRKAAQ